MKRNFDLRQLLPPCSSGNDYSEFSDSRQLTIVGGAGAGKTSFLEEMLRRSGENGFRLSALSATFAERENDFRPGSIDCQFREAVRSKSYMRADAVSQLDKLIYMLYIDEFDSLIELKERYRAGREGIYHQTKLDKLMRIWEEMFPGHQIVRSADRLMFSTASGDDLVGTGSLSQGEKIVLYYTAGVLYAPRKAVVFIENPSLFVHPSLVQQLWNTLESLRPDCRFVYDSTDVDFVGSRTENVCVWVKHYNSAQKAWDYELLNSSSLSDDLLVGLIGARKPVLFIEGDASHSIDAKLYGLVFKNFSVRPLGSCNKVIESTRSFNDLQPLHHLASYGIVDRDRRTDSEVDYLRRKHVFVPDVAEVENLFLLPEVVAIMARYRGRDSQKVTARVRRGVMKLFSTQYESQALQHIRHRVKREVECRIDARFSCITEMERHLQDLAKSLNPRLRYEELRQEFIDILGRGDYMSVLRVFNHKPMLSESGVVHLLGYTSVESYISGVLGVLKSDSRESNLIRNAIKDCLRVQEEENKSEINSGDELLCENLDSRNRHHKNKHHQNKKRKQ